ncbi:MAG: hypothetical protein ABI556_11655 [Gemmatimonadales bacterium]
MTINTDTPADGIAPVTRGPSVGKSLVIAIIGASIAAGSTVVVLRNQYGTTTEALVAAIALVAFGVTAYGLLQAVLAVVDSAGERRRQDRVVSERRQGERARPPRE